MCFAKRKINSKKTTAQSNFFNKNGASTQDLRDDIMGRAKLSKSQRKYVRSHYSKQKKGPQANA